MSKEYEQAIHVGRYRNYYLYEMLHLINIKAKLHTFRIHQMAKIKCLIMPMISKNIRKWKHLGIASGKFSWLVLFGQQFGNIW